jgi:hypothetical protein
MRFFSHSTPGLTTEALNSNVSLSSYTLVKKWEQCPTYRQLPTFKYEETMTENVPTDAQVKD